jgi:photosystem II stability/assembly factor-like uncharacterized protein
MKTALGLLGFLFFTFSAFGQSWELLTPMKSDETIRNCSFLDEQNGYCVLQAEGVVLKTTDGGLSWSRPWTPGISNNLYDVEMVSMDTIFTAGVTGEIFRSTDEGESFQELTTPTSEFLYALEFISSEVGFAVGFNGMILKTTDGGDTWEIKPSGTMSRLFDVEFVNETTGFACGWNGTVLKTTDAGETWEGLTTNHSGALFNCTFPSEQVGYACGWSQTILKTSDGGDTWEVQNDGSVNTLNYIEFKDEMNGWAGGDFGFLFTTTNGGQTWNASNPFGGSAIWSGQYVNDNAAFLMGTGLMLKSQNGASSWELLKTGVPNSTYHGLYFLSDDVGYAAGAVGAFAEGTDRSGIVFTEDGGQTWQQQAFGFSGGWQDIHFADENNGTVIGGGNFGKTTNGGDNWTFSSIPFDLTGRCSWFFDDTEGVIGGQGVFSSVCKTTNGGASYTCQDNTLATDFYFTSDLNGWAVAEGTSENVLHTIDGGDTWLYVPTGNFQTKHSVFFLDENHGWIGAANGTVIRTTDGGETWNSANAGWTVVGIRFYNESIGFCADEQGYVWYSEDGGATWTMLLSGDDPTMMPIEEAYFTENNVYISGWGGDVYKAELGCGEIAPAQIFAADEWCPGEQNTVGFSSTTPVVDFEWQFPEGWTAEVNFSSVNLTAGENSGEIQLTTTNACGLSATTQLTVQVLPQVQDISGLLYPAEVCSNAAFDITIEDAQVGVTYDWTFPADWEVAASGAFATVNSAQTSGSVSVIAENDCGVSTEFTEEILILPAPEISFALPDSVCDNQIVNLSATPEAGEFTGTGVTGTQFDPSAVATEMVELTYAVTAENNCSATATETIVITSSAITGGEWTLFQVPSCGGLLEFELSGLDNFDDWSVEIPSEWGDAIDLGEETPSGAVEGVFTDGEFVLTAGNTCGTEVTFSNTVELQTAPELPAVQSFTEQWCEGAEGQAILEVILPDSLVVVDATLEYEIAQADSVANLTFVGEPGAQSITLLVENDCGTSQDTTFSVIIQPLPELTFSLPADTLCAGEVYPFFVDPEGGLIEGNGAVEGAFETAGLDPLQTYEFTYTYTDEVGCTNSDSLVVYLDACVTVLERTSSAFQMYPNPASDLLMIETDAALPMPYTIIDMRGKTLSSGVILHASQHISVQHLAGGVYLLNADGRLHRFVVE